MKTFCKRHERFFDEGTSCDYCVPEPAKVDAAKVFENMKVPYSGPEPVRSFGILTAVDQEKGVVTISPLPEDPEFAPRPADSCLCGKIDMQGIVALDFFKTDGVHHRRDKCWKPAPFPFPPLPPMDSPEGKAEMERALGKTLKGMFPPVDEQLENATYFDIDRFGLRYPQWKSGEPPMSIEQAMKDAWAILLREGNKPDLAPDFKALADASPKLLAGMAKVDPLHDPATCKICRTINERPAPQQQLAHDWDRDQDVCLRCRKTGMELAATPAFNSCVELPSGTYKLPVRARTGYGSVADPRGVLQMQAQLGFKRRQLAELQREIDELASTIANGSIPELED